MWDYKYFDICNILVLAYINWDISLFVTHMYGMQTEWRQFCVTFSYSFVDEKNFNGVKFSLCDSVSVLKCVQDFKHLGFLVLDYRYSNHMWQTKVYITVEG